MKQCCRIQQAEQRKSHTCSVVPAPSCLCRTCSVMPLSYMLWWVTCCGEWHAVMSDMLRAGMMRAAQDSTISELITWVTAWLRAGMMGAAQDSTISELITWVTVFLAFSFRWVAIVLVITSLLDLVAHVHHLQIRSPPPTPLFGHFDAFFSKIHTLTWGIFF